MYKGKISLLVILGIFAAISIVFPLAIPIGIFLGVLPGVALILAPTIFVYYLFSLILSNLIEKTFNLRFSFLIACASVLGAGFVASFLLNIPIYKKVKEFEQQDMPLVEEFNIPDAIAIYSKQYLIHGDACNALCQGLLFNKVAKKVFIITDPEIVQNNLNQEITSYEIQQRNNCTNESVISDTWGNIASQNVESRIAAGECLVKTQEKLLGADVIFFHDKLILNKGYQNYWSLNRRIVFTNYIELLENKNNNFERIYRYSQISAQPFSYPLSFGYILGGAGGSMWVNFGFYHSSKTVNNPGASYGDPIQQFSSQMQNLFGEALKPIKEPEQDIEYLILEALNNQNSKTAGHSLVGEYLLEICRGERVPVIEDMQLVIRALNDDRVDSLGCLNGFSQKWYENYESLPKEYLQALANRILRKNNLIETPRAIRFLPANAAKEIYPELKLITEDLVLRQRAYSAVIRLGDAGTKALPLYLEILKEYQSALAGKQRDKLREINDATVAAIIGICRLGKKALSVKETLYSLTYEKSTSGLAIDPLIEMGLEDDLKQRYIGHNELLKELESAIKKKERTRKKNQTFCGHRII